MTNAEKFKNIFGLYATELWAKSEKEFLKWLNAETQETYCENLVDRQAAIDALTNFITPYDNGDGTMTIGVLSKSSITDILNDLPSAQPDQSKYEYHYDHTDCIWYRPEARNRCPVTCAQYRDGWNDAMNYIFRNGKGYRPYRRDTQYGE